MDAVIATALLAVLAGPAAAEDACIDETIRADLDAKRRQRGSKDRLFQQTNRHELGALGGAYVSDAFDATWVAGGSYAYHMTEDFAVEAMGALTRFTSRGGPELERTFSVLGGRSRDAKIFAADLVWAPLHAKMKSGGLLQHFDLYLLAGAGVVDSVLSSGIAGNGGLGFKFFLGRAFALRLDFRDHVYHQQLLTRKILVGDLTATLGLSLFLPLGE